MLLVTTMACGSGIEARDPVDLNAHKNQDTIAAAEASSDPSTSPTAGTSSTAPLPSTTDSASTSATVEPTTTTPATALPTATPIAPAALQGDTIVPSASVAFEPGSATIRPESTPVIASVRDLLEEKPEITHLRVEVHTDSDGSSEANRRLSQQRALAVAKALVDQGVSCKRLIAVGFGEDKPLVPNDRPDSKAKNRRTEFVVATLRGRPIKGMPVDGGGSIAGNPCK